MDVNGAVGSETEFDSVTASSNTQEGSTVKLEPSGRVRCITSVTDQGQVDAMLGRQDLRQHLRALQEGRDVRLERSGVLLQLPRLLGVGGTEEYVRHVKITLPQIIEKLPGPPPYDLRYNDLQAVIE